MNRIIKAIGPMFSRSWSHIKIKSIIGGHMSLTVTALVPFEFIVVPIEAKFQNPMTKLYFDRLTKLFP